MTPHPIYQTLLDMGFPASEAEAMLRTANLWVGPVEQVAGRALLTTDMVTQESLRILEAISTQRFPSPRVRTRIDVLYGHGVTCPEEKNDDSSTAT